VRIEGEKIESSRSIPRLRSVLTYDHNVENNRFRTGFSSSNVGVFVDVRVSSSNVASPTARQTNARRRGDERKRRRRRSQRRRSHRESMTRVHDSRSRTLIVTSTLVSYPVSRTILLETSQTRRARGGSRRRRRDNSVTLRALLVSGVGALAAPCAACSYSGRPCYSPFTSQTLKYALRHNCNPSYSNTETFENCVD